MGRDSLVRGVAVFFALTLELRPTENGTFSEIQGVF